MSEYTLDILGRTLMVVNASQGLIAWLEEHWNFPEHAGQLESDWTFVLEYSDEPEPEGLREQAKPLEGSFNPLEVAWAEDGSVWLLERQGGVRLALEQAAHRVRLHWYGTLEYADALYQGMCEVMRSSGLIPLHASVAARDGKASAFLGPSGTGKTTTLLRAIAAGWTPVSEDFSWLEPESLVLYSWDRKLHLLPDTLKKLEKLFPNVQPEEFNGRKHPVAFEDLAPRLWSCPLSTLVVLERNSERVSEWQPLPKMQALVGFYSSTGVPLFGAVRQPFSDSSGVIIGRLEGKKLVLGARALPL